MIQYFEIQKKIYRSYPLLRIISGAMYSGVPTKVLVLSDPILLLEPKSAFIMIKKISKIQIN